MTAISLILTGSPLSHKIRQETIEPMIDLACYSYVARCSATYSALRCLLVAVELLRLRGGGAADEAAKWAMRAREMRIRETQTLGRIGHALITERVGDCYATRRGEGSQALGSRRRKAAMWKMLAANEWVNAGKAARARYCLDEALPAYEASNFEGIVTFAKTLKHQAGYTPLINFGADGGEQEEESEPLELGSKRKSVIVPAGDLEELRGQDDFEES